MKRPGPNKLPAERLQRKRMNALAKAPKRITKRELEQSYAGRILASRRTKRLLTTGFVAGFFVLISLVVTATFSPMLAVKEIYVSGTERIDPQLVRKALESHIGTPLPLISKDAVASSLAEFELIESFFVTASPPNGLQVRILEREPICVISLGGTFYLHDPAGIRIAKATGDEKLPEILITENPKNSLRFKNAIEVLMALPQDLLDEVALIEAKTKDDVRMVLRGSRDQRILWGDSSQSVLKSKVLQALMESNRRAQSVTFDVSSPNAPVVRFDNF